MCTGVITISVQGGAPPFKYVWGGLTTTSATLGAVCEQLISLTFYERTNWCPQFLQIQTGTVSLKEQNRDLLQISPNPVADFITIKFDNMVRNENKIVKILDSHGMVILNKNIESNPISINLAHLSPGLYFLQINNCEVNRFVKE
jgi:hypothetical protein